MNAEDIRLLGNLIQIGTVTQTKSIHGLSLTRVKLHERETDWFPVIGQSNDFKKHFIPVLVKEQVAVFCPFGIADTGFIIRGIFNKYCKEPAGSSDTKEVMLYKDGTEISYDIEAKELKVNAVNKITIICKSASVIADTVVITAKTTNNGNVLINGGLMVTGEIVGENGLSISGGSGASFDGNINSTGDINTDGSFIDKNGNLTSHTNNGYGRD